MKNYITYFNLPYIDKKVLLILSVITLLFSNSGYSQSASVNINKSDSLRTGSSAIGDSTLKTLAKTNIVVFSKIGFNSANNGSAPVEKKTIEGLDFRFIGDFLYSVSSVYIKDFGNVGYPNNINLYGQNNSLILLNGGQVPVNGLFPGQMNLNQLQSESIDSIEVVSLSRSFLFGTESRPAIVFYPRVPSAKKTYSRIKYYQAPLDEAMFDALFNLSPIKKLTAYIQITNHSSKPRYLNSDYSNWMASIRLNYSLSNNSSLNFNYWNSNSTIELNGGVSLEKIKEEFGVEPNDQIVFNSISAPVKYPDRNMTGIYNSAALNFNTEFFEKSPTIATVYYHNYLNQFRQNIENGDSSIALINRDNRTKVLGGTILQKIQSSLISVSAQANIERIEFLSPLFANDVKKTNFFLSFDASPNILNSFIRPSLFGKFSSYAGQSYFSFGADASFNLLNTVNIYLGYSNQSSPYNIYETGFKLTDSGDNVKKTSALEVKASYKNNLLNASISFFRSAAVNNAFPVFLTSGKMSDEIVFTVGKDATLKGMNLSIDFKFWKIILSANSNYYFDKDAREFSGLPEFTVSGGLFYADTLFNNNLDLKAGISFSSVGPRYEERFDFEKGFSSIYMLDRSSDKLSLINPSVFGSDFQLNLFLSGRIQQNAIIYLTFENLLNNQYYVIPYYPKQPRGLRLGIAWEFLD